MKHGHLKKKVGSLLLAATMIITSLPALSIEVHAAGATEPSQFATKDQLMTFNTDDTDGSTASAKLYFGNDNKEWWIAGSQKADSLTLFAASPLATQQQFLVHIFNQNYSTDWGCTYLNEEPERVACKHYGASPIRTTLKELAASYFSTAEQGLMNETTIYTYDTSKNFIDDNMVYSVTDKLYLAYGYDRDNHNGYITVGENSSDNLDSGLHIDNKYWAEEQFWLRTPVTMIGTNVQGAVRGANFFGTQVTSKMSLVPAFELNLSEVIFASAVKAASSADIQKGTIADGAAMTLRLNGTDKTIGTAVYDATAGKITAKKDARAAGTVSLVVQGNDGGGDWYYSMQAGETTVVTTDEIQEACGISGEIDLAKCKIWLETTTDRITYAKMAEANINAEKVAAAKKVVQEALAGITATNETTKESIQQVIDTALTNAGIEDVTVTVGDLTKTEATSGNEGSINGSVAIECGSETDSVLVNKTIPATGEVSKDVEKDEKAPNTTLSTSTDELADIVLTEGEKEQVENGTNIKFLLNIKDIGDTVGSADKAVVQAALGENSEVRGFVIGQYLDISLFKIIGTDRSAISQTARKLTIVIDVPDSLKSKESGKPRTFAIVRVHNGVAETLADLDNDVDTITIATDRFSAYAIVYKQANSGENIKPTPAPGGKREDNITPTPAPTKKPENTSDKEKRKVELLSGLKTVQKGKKLQVSWGRVTGADGYSVYVQYCGKDFSTKLLNQVKSGKKTKVIVKKVNGKKLDTKKNFKLYVAAWQWKNGKKSTLAKTLTIHIAGKDSAKYTNVKKIRVKKSSYTMKKGSAVTLRPKAVLYDRRKKQLSAKHTKEFRYLSSNKKVATVTAGGKVKAKGTGSCTIYVIAKNGCKRKVKIKVKK